MAKAVNENGTIKVYQSVPKWWGDVIGGFNTLSDQDLETYGFYDVVDPSYNPLTQNLGDIEFDSDNNVYTYPVTNKTWSDTLAKLKTSKIAESKRYAGMELKETDWYVTRKCETNKEIPSDISTARNEIKSREEARETAINALTTKAAVVTYSIEDN